MLITHSKPTDLWGKKVFDAEGHLLGQVVAIGSRRGVVRKVVVQRRAYGDYVRLVPGDASMDGNIVTLPQPRAGGPRLRLVD
jgi:hypothetical protein